ncbi:MAG: RteC domain-containing protein [Paludibacter sp.]|nr:RteC domain-containing protein [Paludibacter sp.]
MQQLNIFIPNLNQQLDLNLSNISEEETSINKYQQTTECYYEIILQLKSFILNYPFSDINEEILFFKEIKPGFLSEYLFNNKVLQILIRRPIGNNDVLLDYYEKNLKEITCFFNAHQEFYQYYRLKSNYNDALFFVRQRKELLHLTDVSQNNFEPAFSSSHDHLVAQIIANDRLEIFLKEQIELIIFQNKIPHVDDMGYSQRLVLKWTDSKLALIELIYALHTNKSLNDGECDISELTSELEQVFNVKINNIYRSFQDIKSRNSQTKFIDSLKTSLQKKIDIDYQ